MKKKILNIITLFCVSFLFSQAGYGNMTNHQAKKSPKHEPDAPPLAGL